MKSFRIIPILLLLTLANCFEYEETITFKKGFSGFVEISYEVPLKEDKRSSMIRYLPTKKEDIEEKISQGLSGSANKIKDYQFRLLEKGEYEEPFFNYKGKVSYKLDFIDLSELERLLPGNMITKYKGKTLIVKREFPSLSEEFLEGSSVGEKKIMNEITKLLKEGSMKFKILFPPNTECLSNKGSVSLGALNYVYPLSDSMEKSQGKIWEYKLRFF
ncbi:hypothetical protein [Leptospira sp. GIMC2001]|uniref:hypothetical protein n=1 Tax=Leptospira sp. GIMC2001 TaxID=1513297 RepID=UPI002349310E|nr:hypothetical protein [Leptospira sp. GIMC2001]WCL47977.1 hypothetical protein O4O04_11675 [Leptospira sp. GIMC2001]